MTRRTMTLYLKSERKTCGDEIYKVLMTKWNLTFQDVRQPEFLNLLICIGRRSLFIAQFKAKKLKLFREVLEV